MLTEQTMEKLRILAESAKYDVSCSSSGTVRKGKQGMVGSTVGGVGICHSFADDGRCISLLKVMLTNYCMYDCAYCINRRSNDIKRATLSVSELEEITMEFYRRNYIEGLFLSSGVVRNPDYTMERLAAIARDLRLVHRFNGYIHLKSIPGCSQELLNEAGHYADRMSVNIEIPKEESLKLLAPGRPIDTDDCGGDKGNGQGHSDDVVDALRTAHHASRILFRLCEREHLRPTTASTETTAIGAREPTVSGRLVDALLSF